MAISLNTIKKAKGSAKKGKRVGRGNASGHGTYSTRGMKGQRSRKGVSNLKRLGMKAQLLRLPKNRGFKSLMPKNQVLSVEIINANFKDNEIVNPEILVAKKLVKSASLPIKVLGKERLALKGLKFEKIKMSANLKDQLK